MLAAKHGPWLSTWLAHELLLAHFPALFLISFQQDELHLGMVNGEAPMAVLEPGPIPLTAFCRQIVAETPGGKNQEKQPLCVCLGFTFSFLLLQFLILI